MILKSDADGRVLLCKRLKAPEAGFWNIVGGKVDLMETSDIAARRAEDRVVRLRPRHHRHVDHDHGQCDGDRQGDAPGHPQVARWQDQDRDRALADRHPRRLPTNAVVFHPCLVPTATNPRDSC